MDFKVLKKSCSNGVSEMVSQLSSAVTTFLFDGAMMRLLGEDGVAAITVIIYSQFLLTTLYIGVSMGFAVFSFSFLFSGCNIFASALFTALSNGKASAVISFFRTFCAEAEGVRAAKENRLIMQQ